MPEPAALAVTLAAAAAAAVAWGRALWFLDQRSAAFQRVVLGVLGFTRRPASEVRSALLSAVYCAAGLLVAALFAALWHVPVGRLLAPAAEQVPLVVLGIVAEVALASLLVMLWCAATGAGRERFAELAEVPWMAGLRALPGAAAPAAGAVAGVVEELFFRGVLLAALLARGVAPWVAVTLAGALFVIQQLVQVRTGFQAAVIGAGCMAISGVGGLLVLASGSVLPAVVCHVAFVVFFLGRPAETAAVAPRGVQGAR